MGTVKLLSMVVRYPTAPGTMIPLPRIPLRGCRDEYKKFGPSCLCQKSNPSSHHSNISYFLVPDQRCISPIPSRPLDWQQSSSALEAFLHLEKHHFGEPVYRHSSKKGSRHTLFQRRVLPIHGVQAGSLNAVQILRTVKRLALQILKSSMSITMTVDLLGHFAV